MKVLIIEDDASLAAQLGAALRDGGYAVDVAADAREGQLLGETVVYDAVVLDLSPPVIDGLSVLNAWRRAGRAVPVLILTAHDDSADRGTRFCAGADDYLVKPFHMKEVVGRLRVLIRRAAGHAGPLLTCGALKLDTHTGEFCLAGMPLRLSAYEHRILTYLMHHQGRLIGRTELAGHIHERCFDQGSSTVEVFIARLRGKIGAERIETVRSRCYRLVAPLAWHIERDDD